MAILVTSGRAAVAAAIKAQDIHLAWGEGLSSWDAAPPSESAGTEQLEKELGRLICTQSQFCTENKTGGGTIIVANGRFDKSDDPTNYLYLRFTYDFEDEKFADIRELGIFVGTKANAGVDDKKYMQAGNYTDGQLLVLEYISKLTRSDQVRQQFEFVIQF
ncbi:hypothetical protein VPZ60_004288 [Salmonella enterica]|nr:hypothetical protein [Salmonella enterica]